MTGVVVSRLLDLSTVSKEVSPVATVKTVPVVVERVACVVVVHKVKVKEHSEVNPALAGKELLLSPSVQRERSTLYKYKVLVQPSLSHKRLEGEP